MKKEYSESVKLKYLKQYTEKEAHDLVKNYHHPQELRAAFETLDDHYGKPAMVIRESLRNLRTMETVKVDLLFDQNFTESMYLECTRKHL